MGKTKLCFERLVRRQTDLGAEIQDQDFVWVCPFLLEFSMGVEKGEGELRHDGLRRPWGGVPDR